MVIVPLALFHAYWVFYWLPGSIVSYSIRMIDVLFLLLFYIYFYFIAGSSNWIANILTRTTSWCRFDHNQCDLSCVGSFLIPNGIGVGNSACLFHKWPCKNIQCLVTWFWLACSLEFYLVRHWYLVIKCSSCMASFSVVHYAFVHLFSLGISSTQRRTWTNICSIHTFQFLLST